MALCGQNDSVRIVAACLFAALALGALVEVLHSPDIFRLLRLAYNSVVSVLFWRQRHPVASEVRPGVVLSCLAHAGLPLLFASPSGPVAGLWQGYALVILGTGFALLALVDLGSSFGLLPADRGLVEHGLYRWVRHPAYLGYIVAACGYGLAVPSWRNVAVLAAFVLMTIVRIELEEKVLVHGRAHQSYTARVRFCLLPLWPRV